MSEAENKKVFCGITSTKPSNKYDNVRIMTDAPDGVYTSRWIKRVRKEN
jgi:hypothetical protein